MSETRSSEAVSPVSGTGLAVTLLGSGLLADAIAGALVARGRPLHRPAGDPAALQPDVLRPDVLRPVAGSVLVVAADGWDTRPYPHLRRVCAEQGVPWLPIRTELGRVVIGPVELPGAEGCGECAEFRRRLARRHPEQLDAIWERHEPSLAETPSSWLTGLAADLVATLVAEELHLVGTEPVAARTRLAMLYVQLDSLDVISHGFLPDPMCRNCGRLPLDSASLAEVTLEPRRKPGPGEYRVRPVADELDSLITSYVDEESGVIRLLAKSSDAGSTVAAAWLGLRGGGSEVGFGRTRSYHMSRLVAVLEALERHGGMQPGGRRTCVYAPYTQVCDDAVDPRTLGLHGPECYDKADSVFRPFDETRPYRWVWAYSFAREAPVLVPEAYAYYRIPGPADDSPRFAYEISNGCALGSCLEEAILYGLLEVAERDAFLMTWYARMRVPRIDLGSAEGGTIPLIVEAIESGTGYRVLVFDTTLEQRIPCVWAMAVDTVGGEERPKGLCAAGSHLNPERAVENALHELAAILPGLVRRYPERRDRARSMAAEPSLVKEMEDHSLLYGDPTAFRRLDFLTESTEVRRFTDIAHSTGQDAFRNMSLHEDLLEAVDRYLQSGLDVIIVDQTTPEHRIGGFSCVKVIVPGTLPMTFGHDFRRVNGLPRLHDVPHLLGYRARRLEPEDVNPDPHPFP